MHDVVNDDGTEKPGLYPLQALIQPIAARFKFHFDGTRSTNRLDKVRYLRLPIWKHR